MCGRFSSVPLEDVQDILEEVQARIDALDNSWGGEDAPKGESSSCDGSLDVCPGAQATIILPSPDNYGSAGGDHSPAEPGRLALAASTLTWGFPASWANGKLVFNTRIEKALGQDGMWPPIASSFRCLVPATRFWERDLVTHKQVGFDSQDGELLIMAGVFLDNRFSIVTTVPDVTVSPVHDRMPLCLTPAGARIWMSPQWRQTLGAGRDLPGFTNRPALTCLVQAEQPSNAQQLSLF